MTFHASPIFTTLVLCAAVLAPCMALGDVDADLQSFDREVKPLLHKYCARCHGPKRSEAKIRFDTIDPNIVVGKHFGKWEDIREAFNSGEMPPKDEPQPTPTERDVITHWLDIEFKKAKQHGNPTKRGAVRRLTRYELRYALEDLLHISAQNEVLALPDEASSEDTGLKNSSRLLVISGPHLESYLNVILSVVGKMKEIVQLEPTSESLDVENLDTSPPTTFASEGRKNKPPVAKVQRAGKGVNINPGGYIDLQIRSISRYKFQTILVAKSRTAGKIHVSIGFQHSEVDPRQKVEELGIIDIEPGSELQTYTLNSNPVTLPTEMTRAIDRPFFIRIANRSRQDVYLEGFDYRGNVTSGLTSTLIPSGIDPEDVAGHVRQSIAEFIEKAFRRAASQQEIQRYVAVYDATAQGQAPRIALLNAYKEILCSPKFFYVGLPRQQSDQANESYQLAERLALVLWCSVPDSLLLKSASTGELVTRSVLASHVQRMIKDDKAMRWVQTFTDQWLQTANLFNVSVDRKYYPRFRDPLKPLMHQETIESINDVFREGASALDLLQADHIFVNQTLAGFYQIKGVKGEEFRKVPVSEKDHRGGLLTQATFLVGNSDGMNSHAILRGVWLTHIILNDPPPAPPANVPPLDESIPGFDKMTLNEKLFAHRNHAACRNCHQKIDPWGIPLENYDASGAWREKVLVVSKAADGRKKGKRPVYEKSFVQIDRRSTLPDEVSIDGITELKDYLVTHRRGDFAKGLVERILAYALSRDIDYHDQELVNRLCENFEQYDYSVPKLIGEIVESEQFQRGY